LVFLIRTDTLTFPRGLGSVLEMTNFETCLIPGEQIVKYVFEVLLYELLTRHGRFHGRCVANTSPVGATYIVRCVCQLTFQFSLLFESAIKHV